MFYVDLSLLPAGTVSRSADPEAEATLTTPAPPAWLSGLAAHKRGERRTDLLCSQTVRSLK